MPSFDTFGRRRVDRALAGHKLVNLARTGQFVTPGHAQAAPGAHTRRSVRAGRRLCGSAGGGGGLFGRPPMRRRKIFLSFIHSLIQRAAPAAARRAARRQAGCLFARSPDLLERLVGAVGLDLRAWAYQTCTAHIHARTNYMLTHKFM